MFDDRQGGVRALADDQPLPPPANHALPGRDDAVELQWDQQTAILRGIFGFDSADRRSRNFNLIRARLLKLRRERNWRLFGVVSATPNVGKSFVAANVAASLSRDPRHQTYLVDFDLRRGSVTDLFGFDEDGGIGAYLEQGSSMTRPTAYSLQGEDLVILPTSPGHIHSAELLASARAQGLLAAMRSSSETNLFILDLPPVFANDDALTVMTMLDAYVLIAEEGTTKLREIEDAVALLGESRLAGVVLNKYRGGMLSEGQGIDDYYAEGYVKAQP